MNSPKLFGTSFWIGCVGLSDKNNVSSPVVEKSVFIGWIDNAKLQSSRIGKQRIVRGSSRNATGTLSKESSAIVGVYSIGCTKDSFADLFLDKSTALSPFSVTHTGTGQIAAAFEKKTS